MKYRLTVLPIMALLLLLGWAGTIYTQAHSARVEGEASIRKVYETILDRYVAEIDPEKLSDAAIAGMLRELDPYSQHIDDNNSYRLDALTTGEYGGVGIRLGRMNDSLIAISPMDGTPAMLQGVQAGDRIIKIDSVWTKKLDLNEAARLVRGEKGSVVTLLIKRVGEKEYLRFELIRELIKVPDVSYSGLMKDRTGYVKLSNFSKYSAEDLEKAVRKMNQSNMEALIIDVRGNPGGLLRAALMSADLFIEKGALLLETRGRVKKSNNQYVSRRRPIIRDDLPLAVLIDGGSASASEILAGVLQDYDRAIVIGESSFGKGLVQTVTRLSPETRLKLTSAKYYLPSGRLIQKREVAQDLLYEDLLPPQDSTFRSDNNRTFEGGGGVEPDLVAEDFPVSPLERALWSQRWFFKYALAYDESNPGLTLPVRFEESIVDSFYHWMSLQDRLPPSKYERWLDELDEVVDSTSALYSELMDFKVALSEAKTTYTRESFEKIRFQILAGLEREMARVLGGNGARIAASLQHDRVVQKAIEVLGSEDMVQGILAGPED